MRFLIILAAGIGKAVEGTVSTEVKINLSVTDCFCQESKSPFLHVGGSTKGRVAAKRDNDSESPLFI
jgi:hypothetical protein